MCLPRPGLGEGTPRERYAHALAESGIAKSALGSDWTRAGETALQKPLPVALPYRESGFFAGDRADALGLVVRLEQGQKLLVQVERVVREPSQLFVDPLSRDSLGKFRCLGASTITSWP
ncbi:MAG: hypothetical protein ABI613_07765 [Gemmatimonadota bacterium]